MCTHPRCAHMVTYTKSELAWRLGRHRAHTHQGQQRASQDSHTDSRSLPCLKPGGLLPMCPCQPSADRRVNIATSCRGAGGAKQHQAQSDQTGATVFRCFLKMQLFFLFKLNKVNSVCTCKQKLSPQVLRQWHNVVILQLSNTTMDSKMNLVFYAQHSILWSSTLVVFSSFPGLSVLLTLSLTSFFVIMYQAVLNGHTWCRQKKSDGLFCYFRLMMDDPSVAFLTSCWRLNISNQFHFLSAYSDME